MNVSKLCTLYYIAYIVIFSYVVYSDTSDKWTVSNVLDEKDMKDESKHSILALVSYTAVPDISASKTVTTTSTSTDAYEGGVQLLKL